MRITAAVARAERPRRRTRRSSSSRRAPTRSSCGSPRSASATPTSMHTRVAGCRCSMPIVLGHEGAGVVEEVGAGVSGIEVGDHIVLSGAHAGYVPLAARDGRPTAARRCASRSGASASTVRRRSARTASASEARSSDSRRSPPMSSLRRAARCRPGRRTARTARSARLRHDHRRGVRHRGAEAQGRPVGRGLRRRRCRLAAIMAARPPAHPASSPSICTSIVSTSRSNSARPTR